MIPLAGRATVVPLAPVAAGSGGQGRSTDEGVIRLPGVENQPVERVLVDWVSAS